MALLKIVLSGQLLIYLCLALILLCNKIIYSIKLLDIINVYDAIQKEQYKLTLGEKIRYLRKEKGYSIMNISELAGLSKSTISEIENDKSSPTIQTLQKIAYALGVTIDMFFKEDEKERFDVNSIEFTSPQDAMEFILKQQVVSNFVGFDINKLSSEEIIEFANDLLRLLQLLSYKYKS